MNRLGGSCGSGIICRLGSGPVSRIRRAAPLGKRPATVALGRQNWGFLPVARLFSGFTTSGAEFAPSKPHRSPSYVTQQPRFAINEADSKAAGRGCSRQGSAFLLMLEPGAVQSNHSSAGSNLGCTITSTFIFPTARCRTQGGIRMHIPGFTGVSSPSSSSEASGPHSRM